MGEVVAKQFSALGQEVPAFFFFPIWTVHYVVIFSKTLCSQNTSPYSGIKWVSNNFQANLTKLYGGEDTSFSVRRTIWLGCKMFLFSNHLCSWAERLWESQTFFPTYQPVPCQNPSLLFGSSLVPRSLDWHVFVVETRSLTLELPRSNY